MNENGLAHRLGHHPVILNWPGSVGGSSWAQAHGTHNTPLFLAREVNRPWLEKENVFDWPSMGNSGQLMVVCSNVNFLTVWDSHLMWLLGIPLRLDVSIKGLEGGGFLCAIGNFWFFSV